MRLELEESEKLHLVELEKILAGFTEGVYHLQEEGGCGEQCKITCAHYCKSACETLCQSGCSNGCTGGCYTARASFGQFCPTHIIWYL